MMFTITLLLLLTVHQISSECVESFIVKCDNLNDYLDYSVHNWRQLSVGTDENRGNSTLLDLDQFFLQDLDKLEWLTINNQFHGIFNEHISLDLHHSELRFLNFHNNNIKVMHTYMFTQFPALKELNLVNNNVEVCEGHAEQQGRIDSLNLSNNKLVELKSETFINIRIRRFVAKNNKLSNIHPRTFNDSLEILNLDFNDFIYLADDTFGNLRKLQQLTLSHNKLAVIFDVNRLKKAEILDFSFNSIQSLRNNFSNLKKLRILDLSHNLIRHMDLNLLIPQHRGAKRISLAFNLLTQFEETSKRNFSGTTTLTLFGNPWICQCLEELEEFLKNKPIMRSECDLTLFGDGRFPVCVRQTLCLQYTLQPDASFFEQFVKTLKESERFFKCDVAREMVDVKEWKRQVGVFLLPVAARVVGNKTVSYF